MAGWKKNLTNPFLYKQFSNSVSDMYHYTTSNLMDGFYNKAMSSTAEGVFKAVCLSGIRTDANTGDGPDSNDANIVGALIEIIVRPLTPFGDILPDPRRFANPVEINDAILIHKTIWTARSDFGFKDQSSISFGQVVNCYFENGSIANSNFSGLRFAEPQGVIWDFSFKDLSTIEGVMTGVNAFENGNPNLLGADDYDSSLHSPSPGSIPPADETQMKILDFIGKGEGSYNASNSGDIPNGGIARSIGGTSWVAFNNVTRNQISADQQLLSTMTIGEIQKLQAGKSPHYHPNYRPVRTLFAVGKYQIIPKTMPSALRGAGLGSSDIFNKANQDKLGLGLIYGTKRPRLRDYLKGSDNVTLEQAHLDFAREWASVPKPSGGTVYNDGANRSSHSVTAVRNVLKEVRAANIKNGFTISAKKIVDANLDSITGASSDTTSDYEANLDSITGASSDTTSDYGESDNS